MRDSCWITTDPLCKLLMGGQTQTNLDDGFLLSDWLVSHRPTHRSGASYYLFHNHLPYLHSISTAQGCDEKDLFISWNACSTIMKAVLRKPGPSTYANFTLSQKLANNVFVVENEPVMTISTSLSQETALCLVMSASRQIDDDCRRIIYSSELRNS